MALKKSDLYSSIWASCDELRGGMDASQYKDYVLFMLFGIVTGGAKSSESPYVSEMYLMNSNGSTSTLYVQDCTLWAVVSLLFGFRNRIRRPLASLMQ